MQHPGVGAVYRLREVQITPVFKGRLGAGSDNEGARRAEEVEGRFHPIR